MDVQELIARERIRDVIARYTLAGDRGRLDELCACFASDGVLELVGQWTAQGRAEILQQTAAAVPDSGDVRERPLLRHHLSTQGIDIDGPASARAWTYFMAATETGPDHAGRYVDRLVSVDGDWLIAHRRVVIEWYSAGTAYPQHAAAWRGRR